MALTKQIHVPSGGPPQERPDPGIFVAMGEANIFTMLADFYKRLEQTALRPMFPEDMLGASKRSAAFFVFLLGGPPLYHERYGPPMMRKRHLPFAIDEEARQIWLKCFNDVLEGAEAKYGFPPEHLKGFKVFLEQFSTWMVNTRS